MPRTNIYMPPHKRSRGIVINKEGVVSPNIRRPDTPKGGKFKVKRLSLEVFYNTSNSKGSPFAFANPDDNQPLQSRWMRSFLGSILTNLPF